MLNFQEKNEVKISKKFHWNQSIKTMTVTEKHVFVKLFQFEDYA